MRRGWWLVAFMLALTLGGLIVLCDGRGAWAAGADDAQVTILSCQQTGSGFISLTPNQIMVKLPTGEVRSVRSSPCIGLP